jgi:hypothetical protein
MTDEQIANITFSDVTMSLKIDKNGYLSYTSAAFDFSSDFNIDQNTAPVNMKFGIDMKLTINNPGQTVVIQEPTNLNEYIAY